MPEIDVLRLLTPAELADMRARENREGSPYSDRDMLLNHIEILGCEGCRNARIMTGVECARHGLTMMDLLPPARDPGRRRA